MDPGLCARAAVASMPARHAYPNSPCCTNRRVGATNASRLRRCSSDVRRRPPPIRRIARSSARYTALARHTASASRSSVSAVNAAAARSRWRACHCATQRCSAYAWRAWRRCSTAGSTLVFDSQRTKKQRSSHRRRAASVAYSCVSLGDAPRRRAQRAPAHPARPPRRVHGVH